MPTSSFLSRLSSSRRGSFHAVSILRTLSRSYSTLTTRQLHPNTKFSRFCGATFKIPESWSRVISTNHSNHGMHPSSHSLKVASEDSAATSNPLDAALEYRPGQKIHGFTVTRVETVPELAVVAILLRHDVTGAQHLHLAREDADNTFAVAFRTTPMDSTGVPHILEHTVLCGSEKYPVRDPFFKMLNRSMATFMNAMTASDWTMYPFSTQNPKDFDNLLDVYLDACFFPKLRAQDFNQEGWRLEHEVVDDSTSPIIIKGVVFNEMKGVFSDSKRLYSEIAQRRLLPSHTYGVCSGGDPLQIPSLTWEHLKRFHASHYHPSNSLFLTYGDLPLSHHLQRIAEKALVKFPVGIDPGTAVPSEPRWEASRETSITCASDPMTPTPGKETVVSKSYLLSSVLDDFEIFVLSMVSKLLVESESSPFYQSLLGSNLGSDYSPNTGFDNNTRDTTFAVGLQGIAEADSQRVVDIIDATWDDVIQNGFDEKNIEAILHRIELSLKHQSTSFGLRLIFGLLPSWNHGGDPVDALKLDAKVKQFRKIREENPTFLQGFVQKYFKDNPHSLTLTMTPSPSYNEDLAVREASMLESKLTNLNDSLRADILKQGKELAEEQAAQEDLSQLPTLTLDDVQKDIIRDVVESQPIFNSAVSPTLHLCQQPTNGVSYFRLLFSLKDLPQQLLPVVPIFANVLTEMGAGSMDYIELSQAIDLCSGGLNASPIINPSLTDSTQYEEGLLITSHALDRNVNKMLDLWGAILASPRWSDEERLSTLVRMAASDSASSVLSSGHSYAMRHAASGFTPAARLNEIIGGMTQVATLKDIATKVESEGPSSLVQQLEAIACHVLRRQNVLRVALNAAPDNASRASEVVARFVTDVIPDQIVFPELVDEKPIGNPSTLTQFELPFQVNFMSKSFPTVPYTNPDCASLRILSKLLTWKYLHREIREKGGAYGGGANGSTDGSFSFYSYRDPRSMETLEVYDNSINWASQGTFTEADVAEAKMSLFQQMDKPVAPGSRGVQFSISKLTDEQRQVHRNQILTSTKSDLLRVCNQYLKHSDGTVSFLGPKNEKVDERWNIIKFD